MRTLLLLFTLLTSSFSYADYNSNCGPNLTESGEIALFIVQCEDYAVAETDPMYQAAAIAEVAKAMAFDVQYDDFAGIDHSFPSLLQLMGDLNAIAGDLIKKWEASNEYVKPLLLLEMLSLTQHVVSMRDTDSIPAVENYYLAIRSSSVFPTDGKLIALQVVVDILTRMDKQGLALSLVNSSFATFPKHESELLALKFPLLVSVRKFSLAFGAMKNLKITDANVYVDAADSAFADSYFIDALLGYQLAAEIETDPLQLSDIHRSLSITYSRLDDTELAKKHLDEAEALASSQTGIDRLKLETQLALSAINRIRVGLEL